MTPPKNILVALCGITPQIVTETLYALIVLKKIDINEIWLVTTAKGRKQIIDQLLANGSGPYFQFIRDYLPTAEIAFNPNHILVADDLGDITNATANEAFANRILQLVREKTADPETVLYCSLAGGRKTMSVYLALALQFFGRTRDRLFHILVQPAAFENNPAFFFPPSEPVEIPGADGQPISTASVQIELVEVPYVRLRKQVAKLLNRSEITFAQLVTQTQNELAQAPEILPVEIDVPRQQIRIGRHKIHLSPIELALYLYFAERSRQRPESVPLQNYTAWFEATNGAFLDEASTRRVLEIYRQLVPPDTFKRFLATLENSSIDVNRFCQYLSRIKRKIRKVLGDEGLSDFYIISAVGTYGKRYGIKLDRSKICLRKAPNAIPDG